MVVPPHPHSDVDQWLEEAERVLEDTTPEPQPEQTDNRPRPEDGDQDVDQKILAPGGSPS